MKTIISVALVTLMLTSVSAQIGINTNSPAGLLEISSGDNGILIPRVSLVFTIQELPVTNPNGGSLENSTLVYNTATINDVVPGFYYWKDYRWFSTAESVGEPLVYNFATINLPHSINDDVNFKLNGVNDDKVMFRLTQGQSGVDLSGISGGVHGRVIYIINGDESDDLKILSRDVSSSQPANRFSLNSDLILQSGGSLMLIYDGLYSNRWIVVRTDN